MREWLRDRRKAKGLTMKQLGEKLGVSESYYCAIENGGRKKELSLGMASALARELEISVDEIIELEGGLAESQEIAAGVNTLAMTM